MDLLERYKIDFIVLARYMQIITPKLIEKYRTQKNKSKQLGYLDAYDMNKI